MTDYHMVVLDEERWRESYDLFMASLHLPPTDEDRWQRVRGLYQPGRVYGALHDGALVGTLMSTPLEMALPGGAVAPLAASTAVAVHSDHTRRGVFAELMRIRMTALAEAGEVFLAERPSAATLYGRWGSGVATRTTSLRVDRTRTAVSRAVPVLPPVRRLGPGDDLAATLAAVHEQTTPHRAGTVRRPPAWWDCWGAYRDAEPSLGAAVCTGHGADGGYVTWSVEYHGSDVAEARRTLTVLELVAGSPAAATALWRYLLTLDLVEEIRAAGRPVDEPVPLLVSDVRAVEAGPVLDEMWLRILDVPAALQARSWRPSGSESVVIEVHDEHLPRNNGCYRIAASGVDRVATEPELTWPVAALGAAYLGGTAPWQLAAAGLIDVHDAAALPRADRLFAVDAAPWCGSMF